MRSKGFAPIAILVAVVAILIIGGIWYYKMNQPPDLQLPTSFSTYPITATSTPNTTSLPMMANPSSCTSDKLGPAKDNQMVVLAAKINTDPEATKDWFLAHGFSQNSLSIGSLLIWNGTAAQVKSVFGISVTMVCIGGGVCPSASGSQELPIPSALAASVEYIEFFHLTCVPDRPL